MPTQKTLDARVSGRQFDIPSHARVEPLTIAGILRECQAQLFQVAPDVASLEALMLMVAHEVAAVAVVDQGRLLGIFSAHDHARASVRLAEAAMRAPVKSVMTPCDAGVDPAASAYTCLSRMRAQGLGHVVVMENGESLALLTSEDILAAIVSHHQRVVRASELDQQILFLRGTYSC